MTCYSYGDMLCLVVLIGLLWTGGIYLMLRLLDKWGMLQNKQSENEQQNNRS